jgi:hypothetical protein
MSNIPTSSIADDLSKNINHEESPPSYTDLNPIQFQPEWRINHPDTHYVLTVIDPELNNIQNHKFWSILNILCCCFCLGLIACHYSYETDLFILKGNIQGALSASRTARKINIIATILGTTVFFICIIYMIYTICIVSYVTKI